MRRPHPLPQKLVVRMEDEESDQQIQLLTHSLLIKFIYNNNKYHTKIKYLLSGFWGFGVLGFWGLRLAI